MPTYFRSDGWVKSATGAAVPGAQIYVAEQPANTSFLPPTPLASVFSDPDGLVPITQPILTDGFGHYDFYVLPGTYTVVVGLGGVIQQVYPDQTTGVSQALTAGAGITINGTTITLSPRTAAITYAIDGGGSAVTTGTKGQISVPFACTVTGWVITSDASGSAVVDVLKSTYAGFPTTASIAGSEKPTLSAAQKNEDLSLSTWTTAINAGDIVQFNVNSASTVTRLNITLNVTIP